LSLPYAIVALRTGKFFHSPRVFQVLEGGLMQQQALCLAQLMCPLAIVLLLDEGREVSRAPLKVARDAAWTLEEDVRLFTRLPTLTRGFLVWCAEDYTQIFSVAWERALRIIGASGRIPAGTSLLDLLAEL
jgi:hypothetical protein